MALAELRHGVWLAARLETCDQHVQEVGREGRIDGQPRKAGARTEPDGARPIANGRSECAIAVSYTHLFRRPEPDSLMYRKLFRQVQMAKGNAR